MRKSYRYVVTGRVQGGFFRQSTRQQALRLGLDGWVRNREDGAVEGVACGAGPALAALRQWLGHGPPAARVDALDWQPAPDPVQAGFEVLRD